LLIKLVAQYHHLRPLHSIPTRRSSDLAFQRPAEHGGAETLDGDRISFAPQCPRERRSDGLVVFGEQYRGHGSRLRIGDAAAGARDRKSTRLNSSHVKISYAVFCLKKKK